MDCGLRTGDFGRCEHVRIIAAGPAVCRKIGVVTGGFGDLDQAKNAGLDTLVTGEADYPTEVKAREVGINLILAGHFETETFGVRALAKRLRTEVGRRKTDAGGQMSVVGCRRPEGAQVLIRLAYKLFSDLTLCQKNTK